MEHSGRQVILSSGGMDSFFMALRNPQAKHVFVDVGQKYLDKELASANRIAATFSQELIIATGSPFARYFEDPDSGIIPFRNAELILNAAQFGEVIMLGVLDGEINSDKSPQFFEAMTDVLNISHRPQYWTKGRQFSIVLPLAANSKAQLVRGLWVYCGRREDSKLWQAMLSTVSCYDGRDNHCGRCPSCFKRWVALNVATGQDWGNHVQFDNHPADWHPLEFWRGKGYPKKRAAEIEDAYAVRR